MKLNIGSLKHDKTWHERHQASLDFRQRLADSAASAMASWRFIIFQTIAIAIWMIINAIAFFLSLGSISLHITQPAVFNAGRLCRSDNNDGPNRQNERDRAQAEADYRTNCEAKEEIEELLNKLNSIEVHKLDKLLQMVEKIDEKLGHEKST